MSNPNLPSDQAAPLSAAELRRRLLSSTPPPVAGTAAEAPTAEAPAVEPDGADASPGTGSSAPLTIGAAQQLLAQLRMPGKSGVVAVATTRPSPSVPIATDPVSTRPSVSRRTPTNSRLDPEASLAGALGGMPGYDDPDVQRLKSENKELRKLLGEMKQLLQEASETEHKLLAKEKEFDEVVGAKDAQIEQLKEALGAIEDQIAKGELAPPPPVPTTRGELEEWNDELEKESAKIQQERKRLDEERRQLRDDEEGLEAQMREMEVSMARERAMLARQETELRRLSSEIQHELDLMQRGDSNLRDQMAKFQRRAQEVMTKPAGTNGRR